jgi:hypothetical protein
LLKGHKEPAPISRAGFSKGLIPPVLQTIQKRPVIIEPLTLRNRAFPLESTYPLIGNIYSSTKIAPFKNQGLIPPKLRTPFLIFLISNKVMVIDLVFSRLCFFPNAKKG